MDGDARRAAAATWDGGNYAALAGRLAPAAADVAATVGDGAGRTAVDLAAGTGSLAIALARAGWRATALDIAPGLLTRGRATTEALGLDVTWHEGPLDEVPADDGAVDLVGSTFGLIFAPDPEGALAEVHRVLSPGGMLAIATWPHDGYMARMTEVMGQFMPPAAPAPGPLRWGDPATLRPWLEPHFVDVTITARSLPWQFADVDTAVDFLFENSPGHVASLRFVGEKAEAMRAAVTEHLAEVNGGRGRVDLEVEYLRVAASAR